MCGAGTDARKYHVSLLLSVVIHEVHGGVSGTGNTWMFGEQTSQPGRCSKQYSVYNCRGGRHAHTRSLDTASPVSV
ncbi:hypothetical protein B0H66DRAFT_564555, partial [Apodospora peruviana]